MHSFSVKDGRDFFRQMFVGGFGRRNGYCPVVRSLQLTERAQPVASLPALGPWAPPSRAPPPQPSRGPSLESVYRVSLTADLCEGNKIISFKNLFHHSQLGARQKEKNTGALCTCPVCPLVKTAVRAAAGCGVVRGSTRTDDAIHQSGRRGLRLSDWQRATLTDDETGNVTAISSGCV